MKSLVLALVLVASLVADASAHGRRGGFRNFSNHRNNTLVFVNGGFGVHQPVGTFGVFGGTPVIFDNGFGVFAVPTRTVRVHGFGTFGAFGCH